MSKAIDSSCALRDGHGGVGSLSEQHQLSSQTRLNDTTVRHQALVSANHHVDDGALYQAAVQSPTYSDDTPGSARLKHSHYSYNSHQSNGHGYDGRPTMNHQAHAPNSYMLNSSAPAGDDNVLHTPGNSYGAASGWHRFTERLKDGWQTNGTHEILQPASTLAMISNHKGSKTQDDVNGAGDVRHDYGHHHESDQPELGTSAMLPAGGFRNAFGSQLSGSNISSTRIDQTWPGSAGFGMGIYHNASAF